MPELNRYDKATWLNTLWQWLEEVREHNEDMTNDEWDDVCTAMAWLAEEIGITDHDY